MYLYSAARASATMKVEPPIKIVSSAAADDFAAARASATVSYTCPMIPWEAAMAAVEDA